VKVGKTKFRCSFILSYSGNVISTKESSVSCNPKNKMVIANNVRLTAENGCTFVVSFKTRNGKVLDLKGASDCPVANTKEPTTTTGQTTTLTEGTSTDGQNTTLPNVGLGAFTSTPAPSEVKELECGCRCDCPEDGSVDCSCVCDCPRALVSAPPTCAQGFTKVCPMRKAVCPENMQELCPPNAEKPEETEEVDEGEVSDRTLTVVSKTVTISGKTFKCAISVSHGCVTTLTTTVKCSPGKPKSKGSIKFTKNGYTFQVDFQTPSKVIKTQLLGVPCPKCSCKSKLCSPPCQTNPSKTKETTTKETITTTEAETTDQTTTIENQPTTKGLETTTESETTSTESETTTEEAETTTFTRTPFSSEANIGFSQQGYSDEGCSCVPNFILFFSQHFLLQKNYQDNGFLSACYCVEEEGYAVQTIVK